MDSRFVSLVSCTANSNTKTWFKEAETGEITLEEDDPEAVDLMIQFLYTSKYKDSKEVKDDTIKPVAPSPSGGIRTVSPVTAASNGGSLFGSFPPLQPGATPTPSGGSGFFGSRPSATPSGSLFSTANTTATPNAQPSSSSDSFESRPSATPSSSLFGTANKTATPGTQPSSSSSPFSFDVRQSKPTTNGPGTTNPGPSNLGKASGNVSANITPLAHYEKALIENIKVYILAEKYDINPLRFFAKQKYQELVSKCWNGPAFIESLRLLYDGTPEPIFSKTTSIRYVGIKEAGEHAKVLLDHEDFLALCRERGDICTDILRASLGKF